MEKEFVPYAEALALKELGFDESTYTWRQHGNGISGDVEGRRDYYNRKGDVYTALPLYQQAFRWFREKYFMHCEIGRDFDTWDYELYDFKSGNKHIPTGFKTFNTYEEAELACLVKLIEIVKNK